MRRLVLLPLLVFVFAACGGSDDASDASTSVPEDAEIAVAGSRVSVHYTGTLDDGTQFDTSVGKDPLQFRIGAGEMIPGFDAAVQGMAVGETKTVTFGPEDGYGEWDEAMTMEVALTDLPEGVAVGDDLITGDGSMTAKVLEVTEDAAKLDLNHFLAGKTLTFEITLVSIDA